MADENKLPALGRPRKARAPEGEIAIAKINPFEPIFNDTLRPKDATLATRGGGKGIWIYDDIERDCHAFAVLQKRRLSVISNEWHIEAGGTARADKIAAERATAMLDALPFDRICAELLDAILKGYAVGEIIWQPGSEVVAKRIEIRDQRRFVFDVQGRPRLLTTANLLWGVPLPDKKFIVHRFGAKDGNPYGLGLGTRLFWPVWFKRQGLQFWLTFADKFGNPTAVGTYPPGATEGQKDALLATLQAIANDTGVIMPEGMLVSLLEAKRSGGANGTYDTLLKYLDDEMEKTVLGGTQTTSSRASGMNSQVSGVQNEIRLELVRADADMLAGTLNGSLLAWIADFNDPGAKPPRIWWEVDEAEDLLIRAQRDNLLSQMGYRLTPEAVTEVYGDFYVAGTPTPAPATGAAKPPVGLSDPRAHDPTAALAAMLNEAARPQIEGWIAKARAMAQEATSLPDLAKRLDSAFGDLDPTAFAELMRDALTAANLQGRADVTETMP
jgi:phage gp29-like protein